MKKLSLEKFIKVLAYGAGAAPLLTLAQVTVPQGITSYSGIIQIISTAASWILGILLAAAVVLILIAAFNYITAAGDDTKVKKAKSMITFAIIAVVLGLLAKGIVALIINFMGPSAGGTPTNPFNQ